MPEESYCSYDEARQIIAALNICTAGQYRSRYKEHAGLPSNPPIFFAGKGWDCWYVFLSKAKPDLYESLSQAQIAARFLGISTQLEYVARYKEDSRLPSDPVRFYDECKSWRHFFQEDYEKAYPTYEEAKSAARRLGVHTAKEYKNRYLADKKLRMVGSDLTRDHQNASNFLKEIWPVKVTFREKKFFVSAEDPYNSIVQLDIEFIRLIRNRAGMPTARPWNAYHPHWTFTPEIQAWENEIVRMAGCLAEMPIFGFMSERDFDFYHHVEEGNLVFHDESTEALHIFVQMLERFDDFLTHYKGPQQSAYGSSHYRF